MEKIVKKAIIGFEPDNTLFVRFSFGGVDRPVTKVLEWDNYEVGVNSDLKPVYIRISRAERIDAVFAAVADFVRAGKELGVDAKRHMLLYAIATANGVIALEEGHITSAAFTAEAEGMQLSPA